jgi:ribosomal protein S18 acetylase RimI-like enzyme
MAEQQLSSEMIQRIASADIEAIERATLDAVPPQAMENVGGWLLGLDAGTVGRAHSAVPLRHDGELADAGAVALIESRYAAHSLRAVFRVPVLPAFGSVHAELAQRGYVQTKPTCTFTGTVDGMRALQTQQQAQAEAEFLAAPDDAWRALFLGEGVDPADGASRVQILGRARHAAFARVRLAGDTVAAGMGSYSQGWASIHGMRTLAPHRGKGLASSILMALAAEAQGRGIARVFLQVERSNTGAQALYARAGFAYAWDYAYWYLRPD